jgi:hypothetical protein
VPLHAVLAHLEFVPAWVLSFKLARQAVDLSLEARLEVYPPLSLRQRRPRHPLLRIMPWQALHSLEVQLSTPQELRMLEMAREFSLLEGNAYLELTVPLHVVQVLLASALALVLRHRPERLGVDSSLAARQMLLRLQHPRRSLLSSQLPVLQLVDLPLTLLEPRMSEMARASSSLGDSACQEQIVRRRAVLGLLVSVVDWGHKPRLERRGVALFRVPSY